ncbi:hypothetical protein BG004_002906 [Podila humilis]|nr:hypothetical protein BG004_002906 [Podila humilis]
MFEPYSNIFLDIHIVTNRIGDLLRHRQKMDRIHARVNVISVKSVLLKVVLRQRFLKHYRAVQRIRALVDDSMHHSDGDGHQGGGGSGTGAGMGVGQGSSSPPVVRITSHSPSASISTDQTAGKNSNSPKKRVRIQTDEDDADNNSDHNRGVGIGSSNASPSSLAGSSRRPGFSGSSTVQFDKTAIEEEEVIDPEQAVVMIKNLRSQWRSFISSHDLSMPRSEHAHEDDDGLPMTDMAQRQESFGLSTFEYADRGGGIRGADHRGDPAAQGVRREETLGIDYL